MLKHRRGPNRIAYKGGNMAVTKAKRSLHPSKVARRKDRRASNRHPERGKPAERRNQTRRTSLTNRHPDSALQERTQNRSASFVLPKPRRTFFPQAKGRVVKQVEFFIDSS